MARKKRVSGHYNPDSKRIFDVNVSDESIGDSMLNKLHTERKNPPPPPHPREPERRNCPHPWHSRFLRHNVRWLNEPFCYVATESTDAEQTDWWPSRTSDEPLKEPPKSINTVQRSDFQRSAQSQGNTRHGSNPFTIPAKGILPVNEPKRAGDAGDSLLESISFKHGYNSRLERNEPIRGKLHGSFVWNQLAETDRGPVIITPWNKRQIHRCVTVPVTKQEQAEVNCAAKKAKSDSTEKSTKVQDTQAPNQETRPNATPSSPKCSEDDTSSKDIGKKFEVLPAIDGLPAPSS